MWVGIDLKNSIVSGSGIGRSGASGRCNYFSVCDNLAKKFGCEGVWPNVILTKSPKCSKIQIKPPKKG